MWLFLSVFLREFLGRFDAQLRWASNQPSSLISMVTNSIIIYLPRQARSLAIPVFFLYPCTLFHLAKNNLNNNKAVLAFTKFVLTALTSFHCLCYFSNSENRHLSPTFLEKIHILFFLLPVTMMSCIFF